MKTLTRKLTDAWDKLMGRITEPTIASYPSNMTERLHELLREGDEPRLRVPRSWHHGGAGSGDDEGYMSPEVLKDQWRKACEENAAARDFLQQILNGVGCTFHGSKSQGDLISDLECLRQHLSSNKERDSRGRCVVCLKEDRAGTGAWASHADLDTTPVHKGECFRTYNRRQALLFARGVGNWLYDETQASISAWAETTFGPSSSNLRGAVRANEEMSELLKVLAKDDTNTEDAGKEIADIFIVLYRLATRMKLNVQELVNKKMAVNRAREWKKDGSGHGYHVKPKPLAEKGAGVDLKWSPDDIAKELAPWPKDKE